MTRIKLSRTTQPSNTIRPVLRCLTQVLSRRSLPTLLLSAVIGEPNIRLWVCSAFANISRRKLHWQRTFLTSHPTLRVPHFRRKGATRTKTGCLSFVRALAGVDVFVMAFGPAKIGRSPNVASCASGDGEYARSSNVRIVYCVDTSFFFPYLLQRSRF